MSAVRLAMPGPAATIDFTGFDPFFGTGGTFISTTLGGNPSGVIGGGHVGYNYQINQWVLGLEGSVDGTSLSNTTAAFFPDGTTMTAQSRADIQGSIRGRLGIAWDRALIYATGGVAFGGFNTNVSIANPGFMNRWRAVLRQWQRFEHPRGLDGWRRRRICHHQQLVGVCRVPLYELGQHQGKQFRVPHRGRIL